MRGVTPGTPAKYAPQIYPAVTLRTKAESEIKHVVYAREEGPNLHLLNQCVGSVGGWMCGWVWCGVYVRICEGIGGCGCECKYV